MNIHRNKRKITPEKTQAWSLALYPAVILILVVFMIITNRQVTTDIIGLFIGLVAAGSLQAAVQKKGGDSDNRTGPDGNTRGVHRPSSEELATDDWRRPDDPNRWSDRRLRFCPG